MMSPLNGHNAPLPAPLTALIDREREITLISSLLGSESVRLVTLTGPGGVGKTRLAVAAASEAVAGLADGAYYVTLAPISDPSLVTSTIAKALGVAESAGSTPRARLISFLERRSTLLVLDNFEQVVEAAPVVADLLGACPRLRVLTTSRVPLHVSGEHEVVVTPLGLAEGAGRVSVEEASSSAAVRLFIMRARAVGSDVVLDAETAPAVAEICRRLDGLPLAIELAAARAKILPPPALLARLERRLPLLTGGNRDLPARQRTMRDTIAWSYDLLETEDQALFRRLAVFVGGFALEAAEAVAGGSNPAGTLEGIASLVDKSLLRHVTGSDADPRYGMLETVREYGLEQLAAAGEEAPARRAHAAWCLELVEWAWGRTFGGRRWSLPTVESTSLHLIEAEHDNVRTALAWLERDGDATGLLRLAGAMWGFWFLRGHRREGRAWLERALDASCEVGVPPAPRARALIGAGLLARNQGAYDRAAALGQEYLAISLECGEPWREDEARWLLGYVAIADGAYDDAATHLERALALVDASSHPLDAADGRSMLGMAAYGAGDLERAAVLQEEVLGAFRALDDPYREVVSLGYLGMIACDRGNTAEAATWFAAALPLLRATGGRETLAEWLAGVATLAAARGASETAARLAGAAETLRERTGHAFTLPERAAFERGAGVARAALGETGFSAAEGAGRALLLEQAVTEAAEFLDAVVTTTRPAGPLSTGWDDRLTPREVEVMRLVASGLSNAQIADALYISVPTVKRHLTNILGKLGLPSRSALNTWAHDHGLA